MDDNDLPKGYLTNEQMDDALASALQNLFEGVKADARHANETGVCAWAGKKDDWLKDRPEHVHTMEFRDTLSAQEFLISGLCQACQDIAFAEPDDEDREFEEPENNWDGSPNWTEDYNSGPDFDGKGGFSFEVGDGNMGAPATYSEGEGRDTGSVF